jgi:tryptophan-rich sensory protein
MDKIIILIPTILSSLFSNRFSISDEYYNSLPQSDLTPPDETFSIVWPILYLLIGYALYKNPTNWLWLNLLLNLTWIVTFHGYKNPQVSFFVLLLTIMTLVLHMKSKSTKTLLLLPYLIWLIFAAYLNGYIAFSL